jgi:glutamate transport system permease protein
MSVGSGLIGAKGYPALQVLLGVLVGYLIITLSSGALLGALERKLEVAR